ncbi:hypothetical protein GIRAFALES_81 [Mycobacterium phage Girafales]|nr:hypothetical protein GIRAFALES_81 [Mycobacterium phage Girafales]
MWFQRGRDRHARPSPGGSVVAAAIAPGDEFGGIHRIYLLRVYTFVCTVLS